ncbi:hypothetical protein OAD75_01620 [Gammaproteobacteria bacterium]|mgnify:FL=1|jgi:hypothetical protein|nr:hypothetical protein [Gammaproteobacteria bacterium]|tara:strand:- start:9029 stop:9457 length:429 start_codon:yes stop_codon:yes gene_type:complete
MNNFGQTYMNKILLTLASMLLLPVLISEETKIQKPALGDIWQLETRSSRLSNSGSEVLYYLPSDAYNTYRARKFNDWDEFSVVDSRDIEKLNTGYKIQLIESKFNSKIYKVKLLDGMNKNRNYFMIAEELERNYKFMENIDE